MRVGREAPGRAARSTQPLQARRSKGRARGTRGPWQAYSGDKTQQTEAPFTSAVCGTSTASKPGGAETRRGQR